MGISVYRDRGGTPDFVGRFNGEHAREADFTYDSDYLDRAMPAQELGISENLPLDPDPYSPDESSAFFQGLMPEGETLGSLSLLYQIPSNDYLALLAQLGCESVGALTFVADGTDRSEYEPRYQAVTEEDFATFRADPSRAVTVQTSSTRLSLAGAQSKVAWALPEESFVKNPDTSEGQTWLVPYGTAASTHIIKIARRGEEQLAENEMACSLLAQACGIETAEITELPEIPGAIAVKRYDRKWGQVGKDHRVVRVHQEDFCQALGFGSYLKYQPPGLDVSYLSLIARLIENTCSDPIGDKLEFAKRTVFDYVIGNSDNHLKNASLLYNPQWTARRLAPLYDVTCIPLTNYATNMAFDIGHHRELAEIETADIASIPEQMSLDEEAFARAIAEVLHGFESGGIGCADPSLSRTIEQIVDNARPRMATASSYVGS